ncbi:MAG: glutaredoxin domain-containing protein [Candidatus Nanopelagicales bacterium]
MSKEHVTMYTTPWCGYCQRLKKQLAAAEVDFLEINIEESPQSVAIVEKANQGNQTVPTLVFSDGTAMSNPSAQRVISKLDELMSKQ